MNQNFYFGFTSPDDRLPTGKSGYESILKHRRPNQQPSSVTTRIRRVSLKVVLLQKIRVAQVLGPKKLFLLPFALLYVGGLLLLSRIIRVNIHPIVNDRIGHFVMNTEISVLKIKEVQDRSVSPSLLIGCAISTKSCNLALEKMWKREFNFKTNEWGWLLNDISRRSNRKDFYQESTRDDVLGLRNRNLPLLRFTSDEENIGLKFLLDNGISDSHKIICLNVRDSSFLANSPPLSWSKNRDWSYQNYRDSDVNTYVAAAEALAEKGYTVFRMGAIVEKPLISNHHRVIDYATNGMRTEFLDIYLGANCAFCISTGSGWDDIPVVFRRPTMFVNYLPVFAPTALTLPLVISQKILQDDLTKSDLRLDEIIERNVHGSLFSAEYAHAKVKIRDMSSVELVAAVTEMAARVEGTFVETQAQKQMQAKLKHIFSTHPKLQPTPNYYPIRAEFASCFLSNYPNFLD